MAQYDGVQHEMAVAGAIMIDPKDEYTPYCLTFLEPDDFSNKDCKAVFSAVKSLFDRKQPHDMLCVADSGISFDVLAPLVETAFLHNTRHHAKMVKTNALKRRAVTLAHSVTEGIGKQAFDSPEEVIDYVTNHISLTMPKIDRKPEDMAAICDEMMTELDIEYSGERRPLRYGIGKLDWLTGGLWPAEQTIVAAGPGMGKTAFAISTVVNVAQSGQHVHFCTLEMNRIQVCKRLVSRIQHVPGDAFKNKLTDQNWQEIATATTALAKLPITVDETTRTIQELVNKSTRMRESGKLDLLVVDYLQLMTSSRKHESRRHEVEHVSRELKLLTRQLGIPIITLSQMSREGQKNGKPRLHDLRESGAIEQDADNVMFLWDDEPEKHLTNEVVDMWLIMAKQRSGRTAEIPVKFLRQYMRFAGVE